MSKLSDSLARYTHVNELLTRKSNPKAMESKALVSQLCTGRGLDVVIIGSCILEALEADETVGWGLSAGNVIGHYERTAAKELLQLEWVTTTKTLGNISKEHLLANIKSSCFSDSLVAPLFQILGRDDGDGRFAGFTATTTKSKNRNPNVLVFHYTNPAFDKMLKVTIKAIEEHKPVGYNGRVDNDEANSST